MNPDQLAGALVVAAMIAIPLLLVGLALKYGVVFLLRKHPKKQSWAKRLNYVVFLAPLVVAVIVVTFFLMPPKFSMKKIVAGIYREFPSTSSVLSSGATDPQDGDACDWVRLRIPEPDFTRFAAEIAADKRFSKREESTVGDGTSEPSVAFEHSIPTADVDGVKRLTRTSKVQFRLYSHEAFVHVCEYVATPQ